MYRNDATLCNRAVKHQMLNAQTHNGEDRFTNTPQHYDLFTLQLIVVISNAVLIYCDITRMKYVL